MVIWNISAEGIWKLEIIANRDVKCELEFLNQTPCRRSVIDIWILCRHRTIAFMIRDSGS